MVIVINEIKCSISENLTTIHDSYSIENDEIEDLIKEVIEVRKKNKYKVTRSVKSYVKEVKSHNKLYELGLFKTNTKDTDLEENIVWWKNIIYWIVG